MDLRPGRVVWYSKIELTGSFRIKKLLLPKEYYIKRVSTGAYFITIVITELYGSQSEFLSYVRYEDIPTIFSKTCEESIKQFNSKIDRAIEKIKDIISGVPERLEKAFVHSDLTNLPTECHRLSLSDVTSTSTSYTVGWCFSFSTFYGISYPSRVISISRYRYSGTPETGGWIDVAGPYGKTNLIQYSDYGKSATSTFYKTEKDLYLDYSRDYELIEKNIFDKFNRAIQKLEKLKIC